MKTAGYSGTPLARKLGIKEGFIMEIIHRHPGQRSKQIIHDFT